MLGSQSDKVELEKSSSRDCGILNVQTSQTVGCQNVFRQLRVVNLHL